MSLKLPLAAATLLTACFLAFGAPPATDADALDVAVIACENIAPYLDGDPNDVTTPADEQTACLNVIPPAEAVSIASLATAFGDGDARLEQGELNDLDALDHNRIDETCTYQAVVVEQSKAAMGCTLLVFAFVEDEKVTLLDQTAGLASIEASGLPDVVCNVDGVGLGQDADCSETPDLNGDGVVIFRVLNDAASNGDTRKIEVDQEAIRPEAWINISSATRLDPNGAEDTDGDFVLNDADNCPNIPNASQLNTDNDPVSTQGIGPADATRPRGDPQGDVCDIDADADGFPDRFEPTAPAPPFSCAGPVTGTLNPALLDTDGDLVTDGGECALGSDPTNAASVPVVPQAADDTDGDALSNAFENIRGWSSTDADMDDDGIRDGVEIKGYHTSPVAEDSDTDGCPDGLEISSLDTNKVVNSNDLLIVGLSFASTTRPNIDIDKNGIVNSNDLLIVALSYGRACAT